LILCSTVFFRQYNESQIHESISGKCYPSIIEGRIDAIAEKVMNIMAFVPVGLLLKLAYRRINCWQVLLIGFVLSITIEALQFFYNKGYSEFSDVINNVLGCVVGFYLYKVFLLIFIHVFSKKKNIV
jgi:glycopeptide antibiotics resistance protein